VVAPRTPIRIAGLVNHTRSVRKFSYVPFGAGTRMGTGEPVPRAATGSAFPHLPPGRLALQPSDRVVTRLWSGMDVHERLGEELQWDGGLAPRPRTPGP
jgi:hypothetical protein